MEELKGVESRLGSVDKQPESGSWLSWPLPSKTGRQGAEATERVLSKASKVNEAVDRNTLYEVVRDREFFLR